MSTRITADPCNTIARDAWRSCQIEIGLHERVGSCLHRISLHEVNMLPTEWSKLTHTLDELLVGCVSVHVICALAEAAGAAAGICMLE